MRFVILSPHLDDAVLSAWHALTEPTSTVVTVFAAVPAGEGVSPLDRMHGATDSAEHMRRRRVEDDVAMARSGCRSVRLDLLDVQYRLRDEAVDPSSFVRSVSARPDLRVGREEIAARVDALVADADVLYAPAGIGGHPDHRDVAEYAVAQALVGTRVRLYADMPYLFRHGPPSWLGGDGDSDAYVDDALAQLDLGDLHVERHVIALSPVQARAKVAAVRSYSTELSGLQQRYPDLLRTLDREVCWQLSRHGPVWTRVP